MTSDHAETVAAYTSGDGSLIEIDHLGICCPAQAGTYAIYRDGEQVGEFLLHPWAPITPDMVSRDDLVSAAEAALADEIEAA